MSRQLLTHLGIPSTYLGQKYLVCALDLCLDNDEYFWAITKQLYPDVAKKYLVSPCSVERNIRTAIRHCWERGNRTLLDKIAGYPLPRCPSPGTFLSLLVHYLRSAD